MKNFLKLVALVGLILTIVPPIFFFLGEMEMQSMKFWMSIGMVGWMVTAPFWINKKQDEVRSETEK
jgi:hypothetical protein